MKGEMRRNRKSGFTLLEVMIIVVVIAILVAIAIPILTAQLEKSREAVDIANMRSARGVLATAFMSGDVEAGSLVEFYYDNGTLSTNKPSQGYGKGTSTDEKTVYLAGNGCTLCDYDAKENHKGDYLVAAVSLDEVMHVHWVRGSLDVEAALPELDPDWTSWTITDSRGLTGTAARKKTLEALGLSDNHEYSFQTTSDGSGKYIVYIYNGNFPDAAKKGNTSGKRALNMWLDNQSSKPINISVYTYDPKTKNTEYIGQQQGKAILRETGSGAWIQIRPGS